MCNDRPVIAHRGPYALCRFFPRLETGTSAGTSMVGFDGQLTDEEMWSVTQYIRTFGGGYVAGIMGHAEGAGPMMGPGSDMGGMGRR